MYSDAKAEMNPLTASRSTKSPLLPEILLGAHPVDQHALLLATVGIQRFVWQSAYGPILIEVRDGASFVNGRRVMSIAEMHEAGSHYW